MPAFNRLGAENEGVAIVMSGLDLERAFLATAAVGMGERALQLSIAYARERKQFGRPIASFQLIQGRLADMYTQLEACRSLVYRALAA